jgi:hypothetical protein
MKTFKSELKELYLDWYNNYLTVGKFAEHHGTEERDMVYLLDLGKKYHELEINTFCDDNPKTRKIGMSLSDIETAIYNGYSVYWKNYNYQVIKDKIGQYLIKCLSNSYCVGLTKADGTLRDDPKDFFLGGMNNG